MAHDTLPPPPAVIFDMDGLIFDTEALWREALLRAGAEHGLATVGESVIHATVGAPWQRTRLLFADLLGSGEAADAMRVTWRKHYDALAHAGPRLKTGVLELLDLLEAKGIRRAIATGSYRDVVGHHLDAAGLTPRFETVVTNEDYAKGKPSPEPYLTAAARLGVAPELCWALEDSPNGVRSGHAAGMVTFMVPDLLQPDAELAALCYRVCDSLLDVRDLLAG
jgi:HAD superfamily hydrolase (TIGR01509 family)